jgi:hypothetical protein
MLGISSWARACVPALWFASLAAAAQEADVRPGALYVNSGLLMGSSKLVGMGGAFVGIAEGTASFTSNLSTLAQRNPWQEEDWSVDIALSYIDLPLGNPEALDFDNDGRADDARTVRQLVSGVMVQYRGLGIGGYNRTLVQRYCLAAPCPENELKLALANSAVAGAVALGNDELIVALGTYATTGDIALGGGTWSYAGIGVTFDGLYRPVGQSFRLGFSVKSEVNAQLEGRPPALAGRAPFASLVSPMTLSVGGSIRLGPGSERYNSLSVAKLHELGLPPPPVEFGPSRSPPGRWLLSAQVDVLWPVAGAIALFSVVAPPGAEPQLVARTIAWAPRLGVEHETMPGRLRLRAGTFLEPSPFADHLPRAHGTGGFDLYLFSYIDDWSVSFSFDIASRYSNVGLSVGFWR